MWGFMIPTASLKVAKHVFQSTRMWCWLLISMITFWGLSILLRWLFFYTKTHNETQWNRPCELWQRYEISTVIQSSAESPTQLICTGAYTNVWTLWNLLWKRPSCWRYCVEQHKAWKQEGIFVLHHQAAGLISVADMEINSDSNIMNTNESCTAFINIH